MRNFINIFEYQEEEGTFTHNDIDYDINTVFEAMENYPFIYIKISDVLWMKEYFDNNEERVEAADYSVPILINYYKDKIVILDGMHRFIKALRTKEKIMKAKFVPDTVLESAKI